MDEKFETQAARLAELDRATLTPLVRSALNSQTVEVVDWVFKRLHGGIAAGTAIYRFSGQAHDQGHTIPWSLILKVLWPGVGSTDPGAWDYYKREADAYQSGWLADLPGGLAAPRCFGVVDHTDGTCWMWLEAVAEEIGPQWPLEHYGIVARHIGRFNGAYLVGRPLPDWPWLSSDWMRHYVEQSAPAIEPLRNAQASPWGRRFLPDEQSDQFFHLWAKRGLFFDALDRLPQTICHFDVFRRNLFARKTVDGDDETVLIDWAFVGRGAIGAELNALVCISIALSGAGLDKLQEFEKIAFEGYLEGLHEVGWRGDPQQVRLGYTAASVRYLLAEIGRWVELILDESLHPRAEQAFGMPIGAIFDTAAQHSSIFFDYLDEARGLMDILG
jgi:hypothetical protein